ncbi:MAG: hypothetical protein MJE68_10660, partial [Proteobacteria bacterium]|nr:hypothetical protein [Pseudomonadota bacterium]
YPTRETIYHIGVALKPRKLILRAFSDFPRKLPTIRYAAILLFVDLRDVTVDVHLLLPSQVISGGVGLQKVPQR